MRTGMVDRALGPPAAMAAEIDTEQVLCSLEVLARDGCRGFTIGEGDWPLRGVVVQVRPGVVRATRTGARTRAAR